MQTILIPTNFNVSSLDCVPALCNQFEGEKLNIIFMHMFKLSDSITELLMLTKRSRDREYISDDFYTGCRDLKAKHEQINAIKAEFVYGSTLSLFRNFIEANEVTHILNHADCSASKINKVSMDPAILIKRSGLPIITLEKVKATEISYTEAVHEELLTEVSV